MPVISPPLNLCGDNGVMIAWAGVEKLKLGSSDAIEDQEALARWPICPEINRVEMGKVFVEIKQLKTKMKKNKFIKESKNFK